MKKLLTVLLIMLSVFSFAFANGESEATEDGKTTLQVWSWLSNDHENGPEAYAKIFENFEAKNPNVTIEYTAMPYPTFWDTWMNATIAGTGPDVVSMYGGCTSGGYSRALLPLQDLASQDVLDDLNYVDAAYSPNGNLYLLPTGAYSYYLLLNTKLLEQAGLDPDTAFDGWDNTLTSVKALSDAGIRPFSTGWADGYILENFLYAILAQIMDDETYSKWINGQLPITDQVFVDAMNYVKELDDAGAFPDEVVGKIQYYDAYDEMVAGEAAVMINSGVYYANEMNKLHGEGTSKIIPFPTVPTSKYDYVCEAGASAGWAVTSWTKNQEAALDLVEHMTLLESQTILNELTQSTPNNKSFESSSLDYIDNAYLDVTQIEENRTIFSAFTDSALAIFQREASNFVTGRSSIDDILQDADAAQQRALKEMFK